MPTLERARRAPRMRGAERGALLTQRLLAFSRRQPLEPKPLDRQPPGHRHVRAAAPHARRAHRHRDRARRRPVAHASSTPTSSRARILNLAVNARDAMPERRQAHDRDRQRLSRRGLRRAQAEVPPGSMSCISVTDTGTGMTPRCMAKAFEPFFTTKEVGQGTGLGLSQVYGFVKQSGGHVKIYSEVGRHDGEALSAALHVEASARGEAGIAAAPAPPQAPGRDHPRRRGRSPMCAPSPSRCCASSATRVLEATDAPSALRMLERIARSSCCSPMSACPAA